MFILSLGAPSILTEDQIERKAERFFDRLDAAFLDESGDMSPAEYDEAVIAFRSWENECRQIKADADSMAVTFFRMSYLFGAM